MALVITQNAPCKCPADGSSVRVMDPEAYFEHCLTCGTSHWRRNGFVVPKQIEHLFPLLLGFKAATTISIVPLNNRGYFTEGRRIFFLTSDWSFSIVSYKAKMSREEVTAGPLATHYAPPAVPSAPLEKLCTTLTKEGYRVTHWEQFGHRHALHLERWYEGDNEGEALVVWTSFDFRAG